jgi:hypothetical protein
LQIGSKGLNDEDDDNDDEDYEDQRDSDHGDGDDENEGTTLYQKPSILHFTDVCVRNKILIVLWSLSLLLLGSMSGSDEHVGSWGSSSSAGHTSAGSSSESSLASSSKAVKVFMDSREEPTSSMSNSSGSDSGSGSGGDSPGPGDDPQSKSHKSSAFASSDFSRSSSECDLQQAILQLKGSHNR